MILFEFLRPTVLIGDAIARLRELPDGFVQMCVTSPPYWGLRSYLPDGHADKPNEIGLELTPDAFVSRLVEVFREVRRVLRDDGTLWLNLGDSYYSPRVNGSVGENSTINSTRSRAAFRDVNRIKAANAKQHTNRGANIGGTGPRCEGLDIKPKDLVGIPWRVAFALQADGWWLRQDIIWHKPNPMPESVTDRCTKAHEYLFLLSKSERYYFDAKAIAEPCVTPGLIVGGRGSSWHDHKDDLRLGDRKDPECNGKHSAFEDARNRRSVWTIATQPYAGAHSATFPEALVEPCILAGSREGDRVLDPFAGSGTTLAVAVKLQRRSIGVELNPSYQRLIERRLA